MTGSATSTSTAVALLAITRPHNCLAAGLAALLGAYLSGGAAALASSRALLAAATVTVVVAVGNVVNDIADTDVDRVQKGGRPLPSGRLTARLARRFAMLLALGALALAATFPPALAAIVVVALVTGVAYSLRLKSTVLFGNAVVAALSASTILFGALATDRLRVEAGLAAGMVFAFVFAREILKSVADHEGDSVAQVATVSTKLGRPASLRIFTVAALVFAATAVLPWLLGVAPLGYLAAMGVTGLMPTLGVVISVNVRPSDGDLSTALRVTKLAWYGGLAAMVLMR